MGAGSALALRRLRARTGRIIRAEFLLRALSPAVYLILGYAVLALFDLGNAYLFAAVLLAAMVWVAVNLLRMPPLDPMAIDRRIETASGLTHRPFASLDDHPESDDPRTLAMWDAHVARAKASIAHARIGFLSLQSPSRDPLALRALLLLLLLSGVIIAGPAATARLAAGFTLPPWPFPGPTVDAWITPPPYANAPPLLLSPGIAVTALAGSQLTIIVNGPSHAPATSFAGTRFIQAALGPDSHRADAALSTSGTLRIGPWWHRLAHWRIIVVPPFAPVITITQVSLHMSAAGRIALNLHWHVNDPYGLTGAQLAFTVPGHPAALPLYSALPASTGDAGTALDVTDSPFDGMPVTATLAVRNQAGIGAHLALAQQILVPALPLQDRTAIALNQLRQRLALQPSNAPGIAAALARLAAAPPSAISFAADIKLAALAPSLTSSNVGAIEDQLLALIREIEAGPDYAAQQDMAKANAALLQALAHGLDGSRTNPAALQKLLQAMHDALAKHFANMPPGTPGGATPPSLDLSSLDRLVQKITADEQAGRTQQAAQEIRQLQAMLKAIAAARPMSAAQQAQANAENQAAQGLAQLTTGEARLLDQTNQGIGSAATQRGLQNQLNAMQQSLQNAGVNLPGLPAAGQAMRNAANDLNAADGVAAAAAETAAIQGLQKAGAALNTARQTNLSIGQDGTDTQGTDPTGNSVNGATDEQSLPGMDVPAPNPADAIEDQIIKRDAEPDLSIPTKQYFNRLLNPDQ